MTKNRLALPLTLLALAAAHAFVYNSGEPFFYNDETRHVMTGVYFRDLLRDMPLGDLRGYTVNYYLQYPALGLLVWPPLFYFLEGLLMNVFGISDAVPKALVGLFAAAACSYLFLLARRTQGRAAAAVTVLVFGLTPLVFEYSHYVMLEVPTLAFALGATYHFARYLEDDRRRDLSLAALFSALAALTRFDAVYLLPLFLIMVGMRRRWRILLRREVLLAAVGAALVVLPLYAPTVAEIGSFHLRQATETLSPNFPSYLSASRYAFYPALLPSQVGWFALIPAALGLFMGLTAERRRAAWPYLAMVAATYLTFTAIGETDSRHAIYWVPAFAFFASEGIALTATWLRGDKLRLPLAALLVAAMAWAVLSRPMLYVRGYEAAARYVASQPDAPPFCLFVGRLNGNFIFQLRRQDPARNVWVLRADKLFYSYLVDPQVEYREYAAGDAEILDAIFKFDPAFVVVEEPPTRDRIEAENRVRAAVESRPEQFRLEQTFTVESNSADFSGLKLKVYRNTLRNPNPERRLGVELLMLRRTFEANVP